MKKICFTLSFLAFITFISCEKETQNSDANSSKQNTLVEESSLTEPNNSSNKEILGTWITDSFKMEGATKMDIEEAPEMMEFTAESVEGADKTLLTFHDDGTYSVQNEKFKMKFTVKMNGTLLHENIMNTGSTFGDSGTYSVNGDEITVVGDGISSKYTIEKLTSSDMILFTDIAAVNMGEEEFPEGMEMQSRVHLKRK